MVLLFLYEYNELPLVIASFGYIVQHVPSSDKQTYRINWKESWLVPNLKNDRKLLAKEGLWKLLWAEWYNKFRMHSTISSELQHGINTVDKICIAYSVACLPVVAYNNVPCIDEHGANKFKFLTIPVQNV
jgi:hypothetical protein